MNEEDYRIRSTTACGTPYEPSPRSEEAKTPTGTGTKSFSRPSGPSKGHKSADSNGSTSRKPTPSPSSRGSIHSFFTARSSGHCPTSGAGDSQMEGSCPATHNHSGIGDTPRSSEPGQAYRQAMDQSPRAGDDQLRRQLAFSPVRCSEEETHAAEQGWNTDDKNDYNGVGIKRTCTGAADTPVQMLEDRTSGTTKDHPLADSGDPEIQQTLGIDADVGGFGTMASPSLPTSTTPIEGQSDCRSPCQEPERRILRAEAARACLSLQLDPGTLCFVNATMLAMTWGTIQRHDANWADFGSSAAAMQDFLTPGPDLRYALDSDEFAPLRALWGNFNEQADTHEYLHQFLQ